MTEWVGGGRFLGIGLRYGGAKLLTAAKGKYEGKSSSAKGGKSSSTGSAGGAPKQPGKRGAAGPQR